jgi:hypothetical protein
MWTSCQKAKSHQLSQHSRDEGGPRRNSDCGWDWIHCFMLNLCLYSHSVSVLYSMHLAALFWYHQGYTCYPL